MTEILGSQFSKRATRLSDRVGIGLIMLLFVGLVGVYASIVPPFEGPDSGSHFRYIVFLQQNWQRPPLTAESAKYAHEMVQQPPLYYGLSAALLTSFNLDAALALDQPNPYYQLGLSHRATITDSEHPWTTEVPIWIARFVAMLGGLLAVISTFLLIRLLFPDQAYLPWAGAAVLGFNPQFLFTAQTVTNDSLAAGLASLTMLVAVAAWKGHSPAWGWVTVGLCAGLAALTKYSAVLVIIPVAAVWLLNIPELGWRKSILAGLFLAAGGGLVAGFWFIPNLLTWGTPIPVAPMLALIPGLVRPVPLSWPQVFHELSWLSRSYWGVYGYGVSSSELYYRTMRLAMMVGVAGLVWFGIRSFASRLGMGRTRSQRGEWTVLILSVLWLGVVFVSLLAWIRLVLYTNQGRLLFPAATAIALLLVIGWSALVPGRWRGGLHLLIVLAFLGLATSQVPILANAYGIPSPLSQPIEVDRAVDANFQAGMTLLGADFPEGAGVNINGQLPVTLIWQARHKIEGFYTLFLHLVGPGDQMIAQLDVVPVNGTHPTRQWIPGEAFADTYLLPVGNLAAGNLAADTLATLYIGFYGISDTEGHGRQSIVDANGASVADRVELATVRIHQQPQTMPIDPVVLAKWEGGIDLLSVSTERSGGSPGTITLAWQVEEHIQTEYTVFLQALGDSGQLVAQIDRKPQDGQFPTSTWRTGDRIVDRLAFDALPTDWDRIIIGLYDRNEDRLRMVGDHAGQDFYTLLQNE